VRELSLSEAGPEVFTPTIASGSWAPIIIKTLSESERFKLAQKTPCSMKCLHCNNGQRLPIGVYCGKLGEVLVEIKDMRETGKSCGF